MRGCPRANRCKQHFGIRDGEVEQGRIARPTGAGAFGSKPNRRQRAVRSRSTMMISAQAHALDTRRPLPRFAARNGFRARSAGSAGDAKNARSTDSDRRPRCLYNFRLNYVFLRDELRDYCDGRGANMDFTITLSNDDWDRSKGGWRCPALQIPGVQVKNVYVDGTALDEKLYDVNTSLLLIRWSQPTHPRQAAVHLQVDKALSTEELTLRWKKLAIVLPVVGSIAAGLITAIFKDAPREPDRKSVV